MPRAEFMSLLPNVWRRDRHEVHFTWRRVYLVAGKRVTGEEKKNDLEKRNDDVEEKETELRRDFSLHLKLLNGSERYNCFSHLAMRVTG